MREIKFRGKPKYGTGWVYGYLVVKFGVAYIAFENEDHQFEEVEVQPETVGQYTGLKDRNGREIYEGDVCQYGDDTRLSVEWEDGSWWFDPGDSFAVFTWGDVDFKREKLEIIGNIYEDRELKDNG